MSARRLDISHHVSRHALGLTKPAVVVTSAISLPSILPHLPQVPQPPGTISPHQGTEVVLLGPAPPGTSTTPFASLLTSSPMEDGHPSPPESTALMPFSSGTTGMPKAVCLSHRNVVAQLTQTVHPQFGGPAAGMNMMALLPMFHMYGMVMTLTYLLKEGWLTTLPR